jgi:hypothetical protein
MIRDRDRIYGAVVTRRLRAMGIREKPIAPIGSIRRESVDHMIVLDEAHLRRILKSYDRYYNGVRTHRSLKGRARLSLGTAHRCHLFTRHPWRASSPL